MALRGMHLQQKLLLGAFILAAIAASQPDLRCNNTCGNVNVPYPFGIGEGHCYLSPSFKITCDHSSGTPIPLRARAQVLDISLLDGELRVLSFVARDCYNGSGFPVKDERSGFAMGQSKFPFSYTKNKFTVVGCDTYAIIKGSGVKKYTTGCITFCDRIATVVNNSCSGIGCCQSTIPQGIWDFDIDVNSYDNHSAVHSFNPCGFAFLVEAEAYNFSSSDLQQLVDKESFPIVIDWAVGNETCEDAQKNMTSYACKAEDSYCYNSANGPGYRCNCSYGFQGNPYLPHGCTDIDECQTPNRCDETQKCTNFPGGFNCTCHEGYEDDGSRTSCRAKVNQSTVISIALGISSGLGLLVLLGWWSYKVVKKRRMIKQKNMFFKRNGGLLLQQQLSSHEANVENTKLFNSKDLEKATDRFNINRILGQGGQGTVYKGMLADGRIVAVKKSKWPK